VAFFAKKCKIIAKKLSYVNLSYYIYTVIKHKDMTKQEFIKEHREYLPEELFTTCDVLKRIGANLSDLHIEKQFMSPEEIDEKLNNMKRYIYDYIDVILTEERTKRKQERENEQTIS
jgi:hypothetical protein